MGQNLEARHLFHITLRLKSLNMTPVFRGTHVAPVKAKRDRRTDRQRTKWSLCGTLLCWRHNNTTTIKPLTLCMTVSLKFIYFYTDYFSKRIYYWQVKYVVISEKTLYLCVLLSSFLSGYWGWMSCLQTWFRWEVLGAGPPDAAGRWERRWCPPCRFPCAPESAPSYPPCSMAGPSHWPILKGQNQCSICCGVIMCITCINLYIPSNITKRQTKYSTGYKHMTACLTYRL